MWLYFCFFSFFLHFRNCSDTEMRITLSLRWFLIRMLLYIKINWKARLSFL